MKVKKLKNWQIKVVYCFKDMKGPQLQDVKHERIKTQKYGWVNLLISQLKYMTSNSEVSIHKEIKDLESLANKDKETLKNMKRQNIQMSKSKEVKFVT